MGSSASSTRSRLWSQATVAVAVLAFALAAVATTACTSANTGASSTPATKSAQSAVVANAAAVSTASDVQTCSECDGKGMPPKVDGQAMTQGGTQIVSISFVDGHYSPNVITAKAGMPIKVVFTGSAKGCLAKPTFKSLGKSTDVTRTGTAAIDLGTLKPGVYKFTCAMGMNAGTITVQ